MKLLLYQQNIKQQIEAKIESRIHNPNILLLRRSPSCPSEYMLGIARLPSLLTSCSMRANTTTGRAVNAKLYLDQSQYK